MQVNTKIFLSGVCDFIPLVSSINSICGWVNKSCLISKKFPCFIPSEDPYEKYIIEKSNIRIGIALIPVLGNLILAIYCLAKKIFNLISPLPNELSKKPEEQEVYLPKKDTEVRNSSLEANVQPGRLTSATSPSPGPSRKSNPVADSPLKMIQAKDGMSESEPFNSTADSGITTFSPEGLDGQKFLDTSEGVNQQEFLTEPVRETEQSRQVSSLQKGYIDQIPIEFNSISEMLAWAKEWIGFDTVFETLGANHEEDFNQNLGFILLNLWWRDNQANFSKGEAIDIESLRKIIASRIVYIEEKLVKRDHTVNNHAATFFKWLSFFNSVLKNEDFKPVNLPNNKFKFNELVSPPEGLLIQQYENQKKLLLDEINASKDKGVYNPLCDTVFKLLHLDITMWILKGYSENERAEVVKQFEELHREIKIAVIGNHKDMLNYEDRYSALQSLYSWVDSFKQGFKGEPKHYLDLISEHANFERIRLGEYLRSKKNAELINENTGSIVLPDGIFDQQVNNIVHLTTATYGTVENQNWSVWLKDSTISFFCQLLTAGTEVGVVEVNRYEEIFKNPSDTVLLPINKGGAHWVFAIVDKQKKTIEYYDSFGSSPESGLLKFSQTNDYTCINLGKSIQNDGYQCGVWTIFTVWQRLLKGSFYTYEKDNKNLQATRTPADFRKLLHNKILLPLILEFFRSKVGQNPKMDFLVWCNDNNFQTEYNWQSLLDRFHEGLLH